MPVNTSRASHAVRFLLVSKWRDEQFGRTGEDSLVSLTAVIGLGVETSLYKVELGLALSVTYPCERKVRLFARTDVLCASPYKSPLPILRISSLTY